MSKKKTKIRGKNIYLSMTKDGFFALEVLLKNRKRIDEILTLPQKISSSISDYVDFTPLAKKFDIPITFCKEINLLLPELQKERPNLIIVNGWSQLLKKPLIDTAINCCVGTHPSLLPKNRGRAPIAWHFINEESYGGISLFYLEPNCDSGPIIDQIKFKIGNNDNASTYYEKITVLGAQLLLKHFDFITDGSAIEKAVPQDSTKANYLLKRRPKDSRIDFSSKTAKEIHNSVRAVSDIYPLANFTYKNEAYLVLNSKLPRNHPQYSGVPGQIAKITNNYMWVLGENGLIEFDTVLNEDKGRILLREVFKIGDVLNE